MSDNKVLNEKELNKASGGSWAPSINLDEYELIIDPEEKDGAVYCSCGSILNSDSCEDVVGYWAFTCPKCGKHYEKKKFSGPWFRKK